VCALCDLNLMFNFYFLNKLHCYSPIATWVYVIVLSIMGFTIHEIKHMYLPMQEVRVNHV